MVKTSIEQRQDFCRLVLKELTEEELSSVIYYTKGIVLRKKAMARTQEILAKKKRPRIKVEIQKQREEAKVPVHKRMSLADFAQSQLSIS